MNKSKPGRVLFLCTADNIGGMERVVCGLARGFAALNWEVKTIVPSTEKSAALVKWCRDQGVEAEANPGLLDAAAPHSTGDIKRLIALIRRIKPDVINIHYGDNFISLKDLIAIRLAGFHRCVVTVHHPTPWEETATEKKKLTRLAARLAASVTVPSHATEDVLLECGIPRQKIHVIPNGLFPPKKFPTRDEARARLGLPPNAFIVGSLARLVPHKGIADLITAASKADDPGEGLFIAVAGDGPERANLESLAATLLKGRVAFLGRVPDTDDFYAACDVFALPSYLEGFGLVYIEAAFHGVTSIGSNAGGVPDAVTDGETGILVNPGDISAITQAIQRLRGEPNLRKKLSEAARARANKEFTESAVTARFHELFTV